MTQNDRQTLYCGCCDARWTEGDSAPHFSHSSISDFGLRAGQIDATFETLHVGSPTIPVIRPHMTLPMAPQLLQVIS
jgi:hypothetical protein